MRAKAAESDQVASIQEIRLAVDQTFYRALASQAVLKVAQQTVAARQTVSYQVSALTGAKLRSSLDLNFANVDLQQAKLLLLNATNGSHEAEAALNAQLGNENPIDYTLVDGTPTTPVTAPENAAPLVALALRSRPDLTALNLQASAAKTFSRAERDLNRPTISALAEGGGAPVRAEQIASPWYGAAGVNISIPVFNGFLYSAREKEAVLRAQAAEQNVQQLRQVIVRDVSDTVLEAQSGFQRIDVTRQLLDQANSAFDLAQTRY